MCTIYDSSGLTNNSLDTPTTIKRGIRDRLPTEPGGNGNVGLNSPMSASSTTTHNNYNSNNSPIKSPPLQIATVQQPQTPTSCNSESMGDENEQGLKSTSLQVPKSPRTPTLPRSMGHVISHRFTKMIKISTCDYCSKQVIIGLKCKECKYKCHRDCEPKVSWPFSGVSLSGAQLLTESLSRRRCE